MQTIMNCFPVAPYREILDPPVVYTMYVGVCIMYILCVYYVCIHSSIFVRYHRRSELSFWPDQV